nr:SDR family NAD(P)-dependent oxidoreductase [Rhodococcus sp. OK302]
MAHPGKEVATVVGRDVGYRQLADDQRTVVPADLTQPDIARTVRSDLDRRGITVNSLINNAGFATRGAFPEEDLDRIVSEIQLNITALVTLTHTFLPDLLAGRGALVNIASTASFLPTPGMAVYGGSKAFVLTFTESLWAEARGTGLTVLAVCPGPTRTEFFEVVGTYDVAVGVMQTPTQVVDTTFRALDRRSAPPSVVSGLPNWVTSISTRFATRRLRALVVGRLLGDVRMKPSVSTG